MKCLGILALQLTLAGVHLPVAAQDKLVAIVNAVIIDGNGKPAIENGSIVIRGKKIEAVGKNLKIPAGAKVIDARGQAAIPGLADMHVHLSWGGEGHDLLGYQRRLNALLYAGVTTVLDTGAVLPFVQQIHLAIEADKISGPYIYYVGPLIDSVDPQWPAVSRSMASESQAPGIVKYLKNNGAKAIKAYAKLTRSQIRALVLAGKKQGLPVIVDAWAQNGASHHITTGLHAFAHTPRKVTSETLKAMKENKVSIITTRSVGGIVKHARLRGMSFLQNDLIKSTTPPWILNRANKDAERAISDKKYADEYFSKRFHDKLQKNIKNIFDADIPLVAGTDNDGLFTGEELHFELELLVDAGLSPLEAITTATRNAARLMNDDDKWGTLEPGKRADILLIDGRPDKKIADTRKIKLVMKNGKIIKREELIFSKELDSGIRDTKFEY